jgi:hypothetical protein
MQVPASQSGPRRRAFAPAVALAALYLVGAVHWLLFFDPVSTPFHGPSFRVEDWPKEYRYYSTLQQAVREGRVPFYLSRPIHTRKFLALPEVSWSPQVLLLRFMPVGSFVVANTLLLYTAGFAGLLLIRRRYAVGLLPFAFLFAIFAFNGHLTAHLAVGHSMWVGYFLLPFVLLGVLALVEDDERPGTPELVGLALFAVLLQGALHVFVWCVLFLVLLAGFERRLVLRLAKALAWTAAFSACRLLPAYFLLDRKDQAFISGFPALVDLWRALATLQGPLTPPRGGPFGMLDPWEFDTYVGLPALVWLACYGLRPARRAWSALYAPMAVLAVLSIDALYAPFNALPVPLLNAERVSSRFVVLPLVVLATLAALSMEKAAPVLRGRAERWIAGALLAWTVVALAQHSALWRVPRVEAARPERRGRLEIEIAEPPQGGSGRDEAYMLTTVGAAALSAVAVGIAAWRLRRQAVERR